MKIIVIGESSSGKSVFADRLGKILSIPVTHLDEVMDFLGRENKDSINNFIEEEVKKENWIIDGNAFTKDKSKRVYATDVVFVFNLNPFVSIHRHIWRFLKLKLTNEKRVGRNSSELDLIYFIPYIFFKFPKRKAEAVMLAKNLGKRIIMINNTREADDFISFKIKTLSK